MLLPGFRLVQRLGKHLLAVTVCPLRVSMAHAAAPVI